MLVGKQKACTKLQKKAEEIHRDLDFSSITPLQKQLNVTS